MEIPAAGEHVFAVESIEKKRSRKVCHCAHSPVFFIYFLFVERSDDGALVRKVALRSLSRLSRFAGEVRVSGEVARMVCQVSPAIICLQVLFATLSPDNLARMNVRLRGRKSAQRRQRRPALSARRNPTVYVAKVRPVNY